MFNYGQSLCVGGKMKSFVKTGESVGTCGLNRFGIRLRLNLTDLVIKQFMQEMQMKKNKTKGKGAEVISNSE